MNLEERRRMAISHGPGGDPVARFHERQGSENPAYDAMMYRGREFAPPDPPALLRFPMPAPAMGPEQGFYYPGAAVNPLMALPRTTVGSQDLYSMYGIPFR